MKESIIQTIINEIREYYRLTGHKISKAFITKSTAKKIAIEVEEDIEYYKILGLKNTLNQGLNKLICRIGGVELEVLDFN